MRGRVYLKDTLRKRYGESFVVVDNGSGVSLLPMPEDAIADLADSVKDLPEQTLDQLQARIKERAARETAK